MGIIFDKIKAVVIKDRIKKAASNLNIAKDLEKVFITISDTTSNVTKSVVGVLPVVEQAIKDNSEAIADIAIAVDKLATSVTEVVKGCADTVSESKEAKEAANATGEKASKAYQETLNGLFSNIEKNINGVMNTLKPGYKKSSKKSTKPEGASLHDVEGEEIRRMVDSQLDKLDSIIDNDNLTDSQKAKKISAVKQKIKLLRQQ